eukprot:2251348-Ditylum_brightwellii.AAC.1
MPISVSPVKKAIYPISSSLDGTNSATSKTRSTSFHLIERCSDKYQDLPLVRAMRWPNGWGPAAYPSKRNALDMEMYSNDDELPSDIPEVYDPVDSERHL